MLFSWGRAIISSPSAEGFIVALAGRRIDPASTEHPRFPFERVEAVRSAIAANLSSVGARALVSSAACGADLLALKAADDLGIRTRVVLPFSAKQFRETSVIDRPPLNFWGDLFDDMIGKARDRRDLVELDGTEADDSAYSRANRVIIEEAKTLARDTGTPSMPIAIIVWEGRSRGSNDITEEFANLAKASGFQVQEVKTL